MSYYIVYSKKVARELEKMGFIVIAVEPNIKYPDANKLKHKQE